MNATIESIRKSEKFLELSFEGEQIKEKRAEDEVDDDDNIHARKRSGACSYQTVVMIEKPESSLPK